MRKIGISILAVLLLLCWGCNDWLDVRPKSQVKESDLFESESGFRGERFSGWAPRKSV